MDPERIFSLAGNVAMVGWLLLVVLPRWKWTTRLITPVIIPSLLALVYGWLIFSGFQAGKDDGGSFGSLAGVKLLFSHDTLLLAGWIHYLAFDLFIGSWETRDARRLGIHHLLVIPCLFFTLMLGPVGLLAYLLLRFVMRRQWTVDVE